MTNQEPVSPAKAKYLKRMARQSQEAAEQAARRQNKKASTKIEQEATKKRHDEIAVRGPWKPQYTEKEIERMDQGRTLTLHNAQRKS